MKIAQVTHRYHPNVGGIETHVQELSERLAKHHEVEVITADLSPSLKKNEIHNGVKITRFPSIKWMNTIYFSPQIRSYLKKNTFDVIHAHNYHALPAFFASMAVTDNFIFTPYYHGKGSSILTNFLLRRYYFIGKKIFLKVKKIICISEFEKNLIIRDFGVDSRIIQVIPSGIHLKAIQNAQPFDLKENLILYIGRLDKYKNIDLVIKAMLYLPDFKLYIIGKSGNYQQELTVLIEKLNLTGRVKILSDVANDEKYRWLKTCSLFVNLSDLESFGITVLEALAAEKPVVVNDAGGLSELARMFNQIIPILKIQCSNDQSLQKLALIMQQNSNHFSYQDLREFDWEEITQRIEIEYYKIHNKNKYIFNL